MYLSSPRYTSSSESLPLRPRCHSCCICVRARRSDESTIFTEKPNLTTSPRFQTLHLWVLASDFKFPISFYSLLELRLGLRVRRLTAVDLEGKSIVAILLSAWAAYPAQPCACLPLHQQIHLQQSKCQRPRAICPHLTIEKS